MKKIILILVLGFSLFVWNSAFAESTTPAPWEFWKAEVWRAIDAKWSITLDWKTYVKDSNWNIVEWTSSSTSGWNWIEVKVTEKIPWADCEWSAGEYTCTVKPGFGTVMQLMWGIIKYFTFLASLGWVLFIVINWVMLSMWGMWWNKDEIKKRITMTIWWLILLLLSGLILHSIAPWIYN